MNWSLYTADRFTHVKILVVGLSIVVLISVMGIVAAEINRDVGVMTERAPAVIKAGAPTVFADHEGQAPN
jgi:hypothetical protein